MKIVIQEGHVPRTTGAIGTYREQEFNMILGTKLAKALIVVGHKLYIVGADDPIPVCDVFIALHLDGNLDRSIRGASVGYPSDDPKSPGGRLAQAWKRHHQANGYPGGFHRDNYTSGLRYYYGFRKSVAQFEFLAEHGTATNAEDEAWLFSHFDECVKAHVDAIGEVVGHPTPIPAPSDPIGSEDEMRLWLMRVDGDPTVWLTDLITKRHVLNEEELNDIVYLNKMQGGKMLWTPEPGTASGTGSFAMVRLLGANSKLIEGIRTI